MAAFSIFTSNTTIFNLLYARRAQALWQSGVTANPLCNPGARDKSLGTLCKL
jgi:hypothetical protein